MDSERQTEGKPSSGVQNGAGEMARGSNMSSAPPLPVPPPPSPLSQSWFTPKRLLVIFCMINLLNYLDRGTIASNGVNGSHKTCSKDGKCTGGSGIQGAFNLNNFEDGVLSSAFMVGLLVACPIFASLAKSFNPFRLIGVGLSVWTAAVVGCGCAFNFWFIAICRMLVGVGEASFISLAAPFIDDNAPVPQKTAWLGIFYMCIPTGYAIGYVYGGLVGNHFSWRYAFWGEAILMVPFIVLGFCIKPLQLKGFPPTESKKALTSVETAVHEAPEVSVKEDALPLKEQSEPMNELTKSKRESPKTNQVTRFFKDMKVLLVEKVFVVNVLGIVLLPVVFRAFSAFFSFLSKQLCYVAYNFVIGAYSYWGPKAGYNIYNMKNADMMFGGITIICGMLGTIAGGFLLDFISSTLSNAFKLLSVATFAGAIFCFSAFCFKNMYIFLALFAVGELLVFATQGPVNYVCLHCVKPSLRPLSMAMSTVAIHIFGDVPSSPLVGVLEDHINNWRKTALILSSILFLAAAIWFIGIFMHSVDRYNEETEYQVNPTERANTTPLLKEKKTTGVSAAQP